jgi:uncharacterized protein (TIGR00297 family)
VAVAAALVAGASDTASSEIGKAVGGVTVTLVPPRRAAPGTPGAVSVAGTLAGIVAAFGLAGLAAALGLVAWTAVAPVALAAIAASLAESVIGGALEPRGLIGSHTLNAVNTTTAALVAVWLARAPA